MFIKKTSPPKLNFLLQIYQTRFYAKSSQDVQRKRLYFQAGKRGILELDLLLGNFVKPQINHFSAQQLEELDQLFQLPDWDLYYWITGSKSPPPEIQQLSVFNSLTRFAQNRGSGSMLRKWTFNNTHGGSTANGGSGNMG